MYGMVFQMSRGKALVQIKEDWRVALIDTGIWTGQRLAAVRDYVGDDEPFLANCRTD